MPERRESADGYELTLAVNYLSHFLLTLLLLPQLREPARIVNVSSIGQAPLDFDDLRYERGYDAYSAYAQSKLAQVLFTLELAERLSDRDVTVNALHPATLMDTKMVRGTFGRSRSSVEEGVEATLRLVADPELDGVSGRFFDGTSESSAHAAGLRPRGAAPAVGAERAADRPAVTRWIVDGMNLIGSRPDGWWRDRPRRHAHAGRGAGPLAPPAASPVTVVFDGRPFDARGRPAAVEVPSPRGAGRNAADDDIAELVAGAAEPGELTVVTSDAELASACARTARR